MKVTIKKDELQKKLSEIQSIVDKRGAMPILNHFLLEAEKERAFIVATDLETAFGRPVKLNTEVMGKMCIPAQKLLEIVKEMEGDIILESVDSQWIKVKSGKSHFRLACLKPEEFPAWPSIDNAYEMNISLSTLLELIDRSIYAAGEANKKYVLNSLLFHIKPDGTITVVGTDGYRLAITCLSMGYNGQQERRLIISRKSATELRRHLIEAFRLEDSKVAHISIGKNLILFKVDDIQFFTRLIEGTYPNYEAVVPAANERVVVGDKGLMAKSFRRASIMSKEKSQVVRVDIASSASGGVMVVSASNPGIGEASDEIEVVYSGDPMTIILNAKYVLDALGTIASESVIFKFKEPLDPVLIMEEGNEDYRCVLMPMRL